PTWFSRDWSSDVCSSDLAGLSVTVVHLGEETRDAADAAVIAKAYLTLLEELRPLELGRAAEVSVKLSAVGQALDEDLALEHARRSEERRGGRARSFCCSS